MGFPPSPGILFGTRGKLFKLRGSQIVQQGLEIKGGSKVGQAHQ